MRTRNTILAAICLWSAPTALHAGFHLIEIEQVVAGLNGNVDALAVQLRLTNSGQTQFTSTPVRIRIWNSTGTTSSVLGTISSNFGSGSLGSRILFTSAAFNSEMASVPGFTSNFSLAAVPFSYLAGGKITFETVSGGAVIWSLAYGTYSGTNLGTYNDTDFGAPFGSALPTDGRGVIYKNGLGASTNNAADYMLTASAATVTNNAGNSFVVVPEPTVGLLAAGGVALGGIAFARRRSR